MGCISDTGFLIYYNTLPKNERIDVSIQQSMQLEIYIYANGIRKIYVVIDEKYDVDMLCKEIEKISSEIDTIANLENFTRQLDEDRIKIIDLLTKNKIIMRYHYIAHTIKELVFFNFRFQELWIIFEKHSDYQERLEYLLCLMQYYHLEKSYLIIHYKSLVKEIRKYLPEGCDLVELSSNNIATTCSLEHERF